MSSWEGKSKGTTLGYRIFFFLIRYFPISIPYFVLNFVSLYFYLFVGEARKSIKSYFRDRLGYSSLPSSVATLRNFYVFGQSIIDKFAIFMGNEKKYSFEFEGVENLHQMVSEGKGGLLISAHIGNWEIAGRLLEHLNTKVNIVMYDGEYQKLKKLFEEVLDKPFYDVILVKEDMSHIYAMNNAIANNELICIHADRFVEGARTMEIDFLGAKAKFPEGPFLLLEKFNFSYTYVFAFKEGKSHYHLSATPAKQANGRSRQEIAKEYADILKEKITAYPLQWFNYYPFW